MDGRPSIIPTTTPVQFAPDALRASIGRLLALQPPALYLTHFSRVEDVPRLGADLLRLLDDHVAAAETVRARYTLVSNPMLLSNTIRTIMSQFGMSFARP